MNKKFYVGICTLFLALLTATMTSQAASGNLDSTFDGDGKVTSQIGGMSFSGNAVAIQVDGKIIVVGSVNTGMSIDFAVVRYNANGSLDTTFDDDGLVTTNINDNAVATAVAIQADGKILVSGSTFINNVTRHNFAVVRYNPNGSLDPSFDGDGIVTTDINARDNFANAMAIQADGKIVIAGYALFVIPQRNFGGGGELTQSDYAAVRYNANGSLDSSFDGDGIVTADIGNFFDEATAVAIQIDGKIVLAGFSRDISDPTDTDFSLVRFNSNGAADTSFGTDGKVTTVISPDDDRAYSVVIQTDGKIVVAGDGAFDGKDIVVARYNSDGTLDISFDGDGIVSTNISLNGLRSDAARAVKIQPDGKIIVAGSTDNPHPDFGPNDFAVVRYLPNGALDTIWGTAGIVTTDFGGSGDIGTAMAFQGDCKIVVAGSSNNRIAVARYEPGQHPGDLDLSFDLDGIVTNWIPPEGSAAIDSAIQTDGKIVVIGGVTNDSLQTRDIAVLRYNPNGSLDPAFDGDGIVITSVGTLDYAASVAIQADGKIVVAGNVNDAFLVLRYNADGSLDSTFDGDGIVTTAILDLAVPAELLIQPDGKIVVVGVAAASPFFVSEVGIARYHTNGLLDTSFDGDGKVSTPFGTNAQFIYSAALQSDGKIVVAGNARFTSSGTNDIAVFRYNPDGSLDTSFDTDGMVSTNIGPNDQARSVAIQSDGKIVTAGGTSNTTSGFYNFALVRYNSDGSLDASFDGDGIVTTDFGDFFVGAASLVIQSNGKLVAGGSIPASDFESDFIITRYNTNGSLDYSWGNNGIVITDLEPHPSISSVDQISELLIQPDGKIVAAGASRLGQLELNRNRIAVTRYHGEVAPNTPTGTNVAVAFCACTASVTFSSVSTEGTTTAVPIDPTTAGTLPSGYSLGTGYPAFDITTTAIYAAPITVCLQAPGENNPTIFATLRILHNEGGTLVDRTILPPDSPAPDFATKTICARVNSLSPFVVAQHLAPTAASVSVGGRVSEAKGNPISRAWVSITNTNGETHSAMTNSFGYYRFNEVPVGQTYVISVRHKIYQFNSQVLTIFEEIRDADFTAEPQ